LALDKDAPLSRTVKRAGRILCRPILGGLHHEYVRIWFSTGTVESTRVSHYRFNRSDPAFPAQRFTAYTWSPRCAGLFSHRRPAKRPARLDPSVGGSGPHDFAVRPGRVRQLRQSVHRIPHPTFVTIAKRPLVGAGRPNWYNRFCF